MLPIIIIGLVIVILALIALVVFLVKTHQDETKDLQLRLASKSLEDYHYWRDEHPLEVEHNKNVLEKIREEKGKEKELTPDEKIAKERF